MELDQWKEIWQADMPSVTTDSQKLRALLDKKSGSPVARMRSNLNAELWIIITTYGAAILFYFFAFDGRMHEISWFMLVIGGFFVAYYISKRKLLREMEDLSSHVKSNLEKQVRSLEQYIRVYLVGGTALVPLSMLFFGWLLYTKARYISPGNIFFPSEQNPMWKVMMAWSVLTIITTIVMYYINKWYVRKLYGRHVEKLREVLAEMKGDD
jgi:Flp pilus assembly protein TadB